MSSLISRSSDLIEDFFKDITPGFYIRPLRGEPLPSPGQIRIDVKESEKDYTVHAEVPGVNKNDIQVTVDGNTVTLKAEIKQEENKKENESLLRSERYYGAVSRSFTLPGEVNEAQSKAKYGNGVLTLTLPKQTTTHVQRLTIE